MNKKSYVAFLIAVATAAALLQACSDSIEKTVFSSGGRGVQAILVGSAAEVVSGPPGAYYISEDRTSFHLRCPGGGCTKSAVLPLVDGRGPYTWTLTGPPGKPSLSPSIHWFETDGVTTHWHGWLRDGVFEE